MSISRVNTNVMAMGAYRNLGVTQTALMNNIRHFSTGLRIEGSKDDATGLAVSERVRSQIYGYEYANKNAQDASNLLQVADGGLNESQAMLQRLRQLAITSANEATTDADRANIQTEVNQLLDEIDNIARTTQYNSRTLMDGSLAGSKAGRDAKGDIVENSYVSVSAVQGTTQTPLVSSVSLPSTYNGVNLTFEVRLVGGTGSSVIAQVYQSGSISNSVYNVIASVDVTTSAKSLAISVSGSTVTLSLNMAVTADISKTAFVRISNMESATTLDKSISFQVRANQGQAIGISMEDMSTSGLRLQKLTMTDRLSGQNAIGMLDDALDRMSTQRAGIGALQQRLSSIISANELNVINQKAKESRIRDLDFAEETLSFTRNNILSQSGTAVLAQANAAPQAVLSLLITG